MTIEQRLADLITWAINGGIPKLMNIHVSLRLDGRWYVQMVGGSKKKGMWFDSLDDIEDFLLFVICLIGG